MTILDTTVGNLGDLIGKGIRLNLQAMIKRKMLESIDGLLEEMAMEIADNIVVNSESMNIHPQEGFGVGTKVVLHFGLKEPQMIYDTATKQVVRRDILKDREGIEPIRK